MKRIEGRGYACMQNVNPGVISHLHNMCVPQLLRNIFQNNVNLSFI